jgi:hypothetical protein
MAKKSGPSLKTGELQGVYDFVLNKAKLAGARQITITHDDLAPLMIGDDAWQNKAGSDLIEATKRRNNRIRFKMGRRLAEMGVESHFNENGYTFVINESIPIEMTTEESVKVYEESKQVKTYTPYDTPFYPPKNFPNLLKALKLGMNCLLVGGKGSGKSRSFEEAGALLGIEQIRIAMGMVNDPADLIGTKEIVEENGASVTKFIPGLLTQAIMDGKMVILDEIDSVQPQVTLALNLVLENKSQVCCLTERGVVVVERHPNARICATGNTWGYGDGGMNYAGTDIVNSSTMDRFAWKDAMDYDHATERKICANWLPDSVTKLLYENQSGIIVKIRQAIKDGTIMDDLGMRSIENFAKSYKEFGWHKGMIYFLVNCFNPDYRDQVAQIIRVQCGNEFAPSVNDYDDSATDYIPQMEEAILSNPKFIGVVQR